MRLSLRRVLPLLPLAALCAACTSGAGVFAELRTQSAADRERFMAAWYSVIPVPPWLLLLGGVALFVASRSRGRETRRAPGTVSGTILVAVALAILYLLARLNGIV